MENKSRLSQHEQFLKAISDTESTRRKGITKGPATDDSEFFTRALSDNLAEIQKAAAEQDFKKARTLFAAYIRGFLDRDRFFTIPYETPENIFKLPGESDSDACRRIEDYKVVSVGVLGDFSRERRIGWFSNPTYNGYREWTWQLSRHNARSPNGSAIPDKHGQGQPFFRTARLPHQYPLHGQQGCPIRSRRKKAGICPANHRRGFPPRKCTGMQIIQRYENYLKYSFFSSRYHL